MSGRTRPAFACASTGVALLLLAGCQSGRPSTSPTTTVHSSASSAVTPSATTEASPGSGSVAATKPVDVCALVPLAKAKSLTGEPFIRAYREVEKVPVANYSCDYQEAGSNLAVAAVIVIPGNGAAWYSRPASDPSSRPYPGLGDKALYNPDPQLLTKVTLDALFGSTDIEFDDFKDSDSTNAKAAAVIRATAVELKLSH